MQNVLVAIFAVEVLTHLINAIGAQQINDLLWTLINYLPISTSKAAADQRKLQAEYLAVRRDLNATSSQDEFAKWAKIRRRHDKLLDQLEKTKKGLEASRTSFDRYLTGLRLLLTKAPHYFLPFWYGKQPMFWLPYGWFPYYAEWIISFPRAPLGSVSAPSWQLACAGVTTLVGELVLFLARLVFRRAEPANMAGQPAEEEKGRKKVKVPASTTEKVEKEL